MNDYDYNLDNYEVAQSSLDDWMEIPVLDEEGDIHWLDSEYVQAGLRPY